MGDDASRQELETEIEVPGSYHRYYGDDHYGDRPQGDGHVPEEVWRVLREWDDALSPAADPPNRRGAAVRIFLAIATAGIMAAALYGLFG